MSLANHPHLVTSALFGGFYARTANMLLIASNENKEGPAEQKPNEGLRRDDGSPERAFK